MPGLLDRLGVALPVVLAPMAGPGTPELAAAVSNAGGLGSLPAGYSAPETLEADLAALRRLTPGPFAVNVFALGDPGPPGRDSQLRARIAGLFAELGAVEAPTDAPALPDLADQLEVLLTDPPAAVSFTFGMPPTGFLDALRARDVALVGTATTVNEARALADAGIDAVCAQGAEAGAHRGSFLAMDGPPLVGTMALVPQVVDAVDLPVLAAGGIADGRGVAAALALGAVAAQIGTAFLRCPEAATPPAHRAALAAMAAEDTVITSGLTGRAARAVPNRLTEALDVLPNPGFPAAHRITAGLRREAARASRSDLMALWAGQGAPLGRDVPARELVGLLVAEAAAAVVR